MNKTLTFALVDELTGLTVDEVPGEVGAYKYGHTTVFGGVLYSVVKLVHPSSHYTQVFLRKF